MSSAVGGAGHDSKFRGAGPGAGHAQGGKPHFFGIRKGGPPHPRRSDDILRRENPFGDNRVFLSTWTPPMTDAAALTALPSDKELVLRVIPMPSDSNANGDIFGGWIMAQVDLAGSVLPVRIAKGRVTTVAVNQFIFKQPVSIGDLLSFYATVERIGNTSITVRVEVYAERNPADLQVVKVTEANLTYVAIDREGKPRLVPKG